MAHASLLAKISGPVPKRTNRALSRKPASRKQRPFADGWRKIDVPTLDDAGDDDQIVLYCPPAKLLRHDKGFPHGMPTTEVETINADLPIKGQRNWGTGLPLRRRAVRTPIDPPSRPAHLARRHHEKMTFRKNGRRSETEMSASTARMIVPAPRLRESRAC